jgi:hypothetical protein
MVYTYSIVENLRKIKHVFEKLLQIIFYTQIKILRMSSVRVINYVTNRKIDVSIFKHIFAKTGSTRPSVISARMSVTSVIFTYKVWFLHAKRDFDTQECHFHTHKCDLDTHECDWLRHANVLLPHAACDFKTNQLKLT